MRRFAFTIIISQILSPYIWENFTLPAIVSAHTFLIFPFFLPFSLRPSFLTHIFPLLFLSFLAPAMPLTNYLLLCFSSILPVFLISFSFFGILPSSLVVHSHTSFLSKNSSLLSSNSVTLSLSDPKSKIVRVEASVLIYRHIVTSSIVQRCTSLSTVVSISVSICTSRMLTGSWKGGKKATTSIFNMY
jgi:hypothetical protein